MEKVIIVILFFLVAGFVANYQAYGKDDTTLSFDYLVKEDDANDKLKWKVLQGFGDLYKEMGGFHSGEDWNLIGGRPDSDLGKPVYAITKGKVAKKSPLGKPPGKLGYLIGLEHILAEGQTFLIPEKKNQSYYYKKEQVSKIYSIYIHIKPESGIDTGIQVDKGQTVGYITEISPLSPHLHFEIRHPKTEHSIDWSMVYNQNRDTCNWAKVEGKITGYYLNSHKMVNAGLRHPSEFIKANPCLVFPVSTKPLSITKLNILGKWVNEDIRLSEISSLLFETSGTVLMNGPIGNVRIRTRDCSSGQWEIVQGNKINFSFTEQSALKATGQIDGDSIREFKIAPFGEGTTLIKDLKAEIVVTIPEGKIWSEYVWRQDPKLSVIPRQTALRLKIRHDKTFLAAVSVIWRWKIVDGTLVKIYRQDENGNVIENSVLEIKENKLVDKLSGSSYVRATSSP